MSLGAELRERVLKDFERRRRESPGLERLEKAKEAGKATYKEADEYAVAVGDMLAKSYEANITQDLLPLGKMDYETAAEVVRPPLELDYDIISQYVAEIQKALNTQAGLGLNAVVPEVDENRIQGIIDHIAAAPDYDSTSWILGEPVRNFSQNIVDESAKQNFEYQSKSGLSPKIIRTAEAPGIRSIKRGKKTYKYQVPCKWCAALAGTYDYNKVKATGSDVYRRHEGCRCIVEYSPDGVKRQNVHTKEWVDQKTINQRIAIQPPPPPTQTQIQAIINRPDILNRLDSEKVKKLPVKDLLKKLSLDEIIEKVGGGDKTKGSCASAALAYIANLGGLDVLDFRGGKSLDFFSQVPNLVDLLNLDGVIGKAFRDKTEMAAAISAIAEIQEGRLYMFGVAQHVAVVRLNDGLYEYLELQSALHNGWHTLTESELKFRFGARERASVFDLPGEQKTALILDAESLYSNPYFKELMSYINTAADKQRKGTRGSIK